MKNNFIEIELLMKLLNKPYLFLPKKGIVYYKYDSNLEEILLLHLNKMSIGSKLINIITSNELTLISFNVNSENIKYNIDLKINESIKNVQSNIIKIII